MLYKKAAIPFAKAFACFLTKSRIALRYDSTFRITL